MHGFGTPFHWRKTMLQLCDVRVSASEVQQREKFMESAHKFKIAFELTCIIFMGK